MASDMKSIMVPLKGGNYATWKVQCRMWLMKDGLWHIVNGTETSTTTEDARKFQTRKDRALATIVLSIDPSLLYLLGDPEDPAVVWAKLADQFQKKTWANKLALRRRLYGMRLKENQPVQGHIKSMMEIFEELCVIGDPVEEEDRVVHLLASLPEPFDMLVTALESNAEVPKLEIVTERLMHEERKLKEKSTLIDSEGRSKALNAAGERYKQNTGGPKCYYCGKTGHIKRFCDKFKRKEKSDGKRGHDFKKENANLSERKHHDEYSSDSDYGFIVVGSHALSSVTQDEKKKWIIDSGATSHMCNDEKQFSEIKNLKKPEKIKVGDGFSVLAERKGTIELQLQLSEGVIKPCKLFNVLFVPDLSYSLVSVSKAAENGKIVEFDGEGCKIVDKNSGKLVSTAKRNGNLYYLNTVHNDESVHTAGVSLDISKQRLWHSRYGHLGNKSLNNLSSNNMVSGFEYKLLNNKDKTFCEPCIEGKQHRQKFPKGGGKRATDVLELVHTDVCGKMDVKSLGGKEYFVSFIDDKSRFTWTFPVKQKSDVYDKFIGWKSMAERLTGKNLKTLRSDNGGEYVSNEFNDFSKDEGILRQHTIPKTPEQNGVSERMNRTLVECMRSMLCESKLPKSFWAEALATATYLRNRSPTKAVEGITPYEAFLGEKPNVEHLRVFGSICYAHIPKDERKKLDSKARKSIFIGYGTDVKGYRLYNLQTQKAFHSRDVVFNEMKFRGDNTETNVDISTVKMMTKETEIPIVEKIFTDSLDDQPSISVDVVDENELAPVDHVTDAPSQNEGQRKSSRNKRTPEHYGDWVNIASEVEPVTMNDAVSGVKSKEWTEAMRNEIDSLNENKVWVLAPLPKGRKAIGCKWIFKTKVDGDGNIERHKARLVAQGFTQRYGVDYDETFSPVVRFETIRTVVAMGAKYDLKLHQMDVKTAFLNGELKEEIFMRQPEGFVVEGKENLVCKLNRSIYGLKQSARCWNAELDRKLKEMRFIQSNSDPCMYTRVSGGEMFIIAVYVDDIILGGESDKTIEEVKKVISEKFDVTDMGLLHYFLGVKVIQNKKSGKIWIGQPNYTKELLIRFQMAESKPVDTPMEVGLKLIKKDDGEDCFDKEKYQSAVGSLLYLSTRTRPDIAFAVSNTARFCSQPTNHHWCAVKRILRYLKGTIHLGLLYRWKKEAKLVGFSDADWAGDINDRKSTSGYVLLLCGSAVSWRSKKQSCVALSTAEAEYMALASATQEAVWLRQLIADINEQDVDLTKPTRIYEDNQSSICMAKNHQFHGRSKHIDIKFHFVREQVGFGSIELVYCKSEDMIADVFTKGLPGQQFKKLRSLLGIATTIEEE